MSKNRKADLYPSSRRLKLENMLKKKTPLFYIIKVGNSVSVSFKTTHSLVKDI